MQINGSETGIVRLFHLDLPREAVERFTTQAGTGEWPLKYALGAKTLRADFVDVVDIRDLGDMVLSDYLAQAHNATGSDFRALRQRIDALRGHAVVIPSQAFGNTAQTLTVANPLRWIGTFGEVKPKSPGPKLQSDAARPGESRPADTQPPIRTSGALRLATLGLGVLAILLLALFLR
ncbi:aspartate carbamoyltransferase catalytic subunit [Thalassococcus arenae]|nr:aspartate carbamoyltransferase catalytic subunit [Thalassococcus arenae]